MAPAIETDIYPDFPISRSLKTDPYYSPSDSVDLLLSSGLDHLNAIRSRYQDYLGSVATHLNPSSILSIAWLLTIRCFSPARVIYLDSHSHLCHISDTFEPGTGVVPLELYPETPLKDLIRDVCLILSGSRSTAEGKAPETQKRFLTSALRYSGDSPVDLDVNLVNSKLSETKLMLDITKQTDQLHAKLAFSVPDITKDFAASLLYTFDKALVSIYSAALQSLEELDLCSAHDLKLIQGYTHKISESYEVLLHDVVLRHAQSTPDAPAVCSWDGDLTYRELDELSSKLALFLVRIGVVPETFVISCFEKSTWAIVARLAILKAGGAYISIDATEPPIFLESVIRRVNAKIMLSSPKFQSKYVPMIATVIAISATMLNNLPAAPDTVCRTVQPNNACLLLFTSGSTGQPKGIIQEHRSYATAIRDYNKVLGLDPHSRVFQVDDYAFDISNNDYLTALYAGGCCCVPTPERTIASLVASVNALQANTTFLTPTLAIQFTPDDTPTLKTVHIGGEPMSNDLLTRWGPHVHLFNQYGMGEAATFCAFNDSPKPGQNAIVGRPRSGAIWITNPISPELPLPVGAIGEILIEGPHLARGYLDNLCQNPHVGFVDPIPQWIANLHPSRAATTRIYRSGDLGRYKHDGTVEHMGRKDTLLKLNGCRVESTEVEYVLRKSLAPGDFAIIDVLGAFNGAHHPQLVAFLYLADNPTNLVPSTSDDAITFLPVTDVLRVNEMAEAMKDEIRDNLPVHMIPQMIILVNKIPRTKSNKTDRRKLHHLAQEWFMSR
ncbi:hypothetical protein ASPWEDRAFT_40602 [Aspergillus wentii DTO 134E9]|uniref:AMP-dependent synthetase/ligase domain-containing protein n=1 Tax=Aspergillus wentii DTO 134E9 TaxID=1073089 RepID=A0A1L9RKP1_ASPWE|nr:uncharacterized protein ASPWEDRAFT_40602 [Aspergillus wentii DTO 134E9]OJJ35407.1 hypothetical protein ASPWEDRAFT_40602 [Aspergillus wentii DTO 134E9]